MSATASTTTNPQTIPTGVYLVEAPCPRCGVVEEILVALRSVLTMPEDDAGTIRVRVKGKARDHDCKQNRLAVAVTPTSK